VAEAGGGVTHGERWFSWRCTDGRQIDWWSHHVTRDRNRFVHNEWGRFALAVDLQAREAQIQFNNPPEWQSLKFASIVDENSKLALEAACDARELRFAAELFLRIIGRDDMADALYTQKRATT
jgi:hypothetical protein